MTTHRAFIAGATGVAAPCATIAIAVARAQTKSLPSQRDIGRVTATRAIEKKANAVGDTQLNT